MPRLHTHDKIRRKCGNVARKLCNHFCNQKPSFRLLPDDYQLTGRLLVGLDKRLWIKGIHFISQVAKHTYENSGACFPSWMSWVRIPSPAFLNTYKLKTYGHCPIGALLKMALSALLSALLDPTVSLLCVYSELGFGDYLTLFSVGKWGLQKSIESLKEGAGYLYFSRHTSFLNSVYPNRRATTAKTNNNLSFSPFLKA